MKVLSDILHKAGILKENAETYSSGGYSVVVRNATTQRFETIPSSGLIPDQSGNAGKFLTTNGSTLSWGTVSSVNIYNSNGTLTEDRTVTSGGYKLSFSNNGIGQTTSGGIVLGNSTVSTGGVNQYSPPIVMSGNGWNFSGSTPVSIRQYLKPLTGSLPAPVWALESSINNGTYTPMLRSFGNSTVNSLAIGTASEVTDSTLAGTAKTSLYVAGDIRTFGGYMYNLGLISSANGSNIQSYTNGGASPLQSIYFGFYNTAFQTNIPSTPGVNSYGGEVAITGVISVLAPGSGTLSHSAFRVSPTINNTGGTSTIRGIYYNPILTSLSGTKHIAFQNETGLNSFNNTSGNTVIGGNTDSGYKFYVVGTSKLSGKVVMGDLDINQDPYVDIFAGSTTAGLSSGLRLRHSVSEANTMTMNFGVNNTGGGGDNQGYGYIQAVYWGGTVNNPIFINPKSTVGIVINHDSYGASTIIAGNSIVAQGSMLIKPASNTNSGVIKGYGFAANAYNAGGGSFSSGMYGQFAASSWQNGIDLVFITISGPDVTGAEGVERLRIKNTGEVSVSNLSGTGTRMVVANGSGVLSTQTILANQISGTGQSGQVAYWNSTSTQTGSNNLFWDISNSRLGIGTNNPSYSLDVRGVVGATDAIYLNSTTDALLSFQNGGFSKWRIGNADISGSNYFQLYDSVSSAERIRWNNDATATFTSDITFVGKTNTPVTITAAQPTLLIDATGATNAVNIDLKPSGGQNATIQNTGGSAIEFYTGSTIGIAATITASKNVLVGSSTEGTGRLQVSNTSGDSHILVWGSTAPSIRIDNAATGSSQRLVIGLSTASSNFISTSVAGDICITTQSSNPLLFGANATEAMRISTAARVLIGKTLDGGQKLQVNGTVNLSGLPTSATGLNAGDLWNNGGVINIA